MFVFGNVWCALNDKTDENYNGDEKCELAGADKKVNTG